MYDQLAQPCGIYRSRLERQWANWFHLYKIPAKYADKHWHDFVVGERFIEIKPHGESFLLAAISRMPRDVTLIVIQGSIFNHIAWSCVRIENSAYVDCKPVRLSKLFNVGSAE